MAACKSWLEPTHGWRKEIEGDDEMTYPEDKSPLPRSDKKSGIFDVFLMGQ